MLNSVPLGQAYVGLDFDRLLSRGNQKRVSQLAKARWLLQHRAHEGTLIADKALRLPIVAHGRLAVRISGRFRAIGLIRRKRGKRKQRDSDSVGAFVRQKVTVMRAAEPFDQRNPHLSVDLELVEFARIDDITKIASNHRTPPTLQTPSSPELTADCPRRGFEPGCQGSLLPQLSCRCRRSRR